MCAILDKRILKTKKALKDALLRLLKAKNFENINTTEICKTAMVSRNTFYHYYADKYALLEDCFSGFEEEFLEHYGELQRQNNPGQKMTQNYLNLVDSFLDMKERYGTLRILSSFDLMTLYYRASMNILNKYENRYKSYISPSYDLTQLNSFLVLGFWGYIHGNDKMSDDLIRNRSRKLMLDLLKSPIFKTEK